MQYVAPYREAHCAFEVDELIEKFAQGSQLFSVAQPKTQSLGALYFHTKT